MSLLHDYSLRRAIPGAVPRMGINSWRSRDRTFDIPDFSRILIIAMLLVKQQENGMRIEQKLVPKTGRDGLVAPLRMIRKGLG